jgi:acetylornithine/succinyldiaminopimelate/putrescine aminotransferase
LLQGGTYGGNAVVCAAAVATIDVLRCGPVAPPLAARDSHAAMHHALLVCREEQVLDNVKQRGIQLMRGL